MRELTRRAHIVALPPTHSHADTIEAAASTAAGLLAQSADGFTVAAFSDATGASRKYVLPLVAELDARGVTRRREDVRIAGPRLPEL